MPVTRTLSNVKWGYADTWHAAADTVEPASAATLSEPATGWTGVGYTSEGVTMEVGKDTEMVRVEESLTPAGIVVTGSDVKITFEIAEDTLEARQLAYGLGTISTTAAATGQIGKKTLTLDDSLDVIALCFIADNAQGFRDRVYIPRMMSSGAVGTAYQRAAKRVFPVEFTAICELAAIKIVKQTAAAV